MERKNQKNKAPNVNKESNVKKNDNTLSPYPVMQGSTKSDSSELINGSQNSSNKENSIEKINTEDIKPINQGNNDLLEQELSLGGSTKSNIAIKITKKLKK